MSRRPIDAPTIAGMVIAAARPADLETQLLAATGCGPAEIGQLLGAGPDRAAAALRPFLVNQPDDPADVARAIAADPTALAAIGALYVDIEQQAEQQAEQPAGEAA